MNEAKDFEWAKAYVKSVYWREAKTYRNTTPHEYIVVRQGDPRRGEFRKMFTLIEKYGKIEKFFGIDYKYLFLGDGYKYFAGDGGGWKENNCILNRAKADVVYGRQS